MKRRCIGIAVAGLSLVVAACTSSSDPSTTTITAAPTEATAAVPPRQTSAEEIYEQVAPSLAFLETDIASGSGILIDTETVLTAAHVVWPYREVRVVFPNGTEVRAAPVIGADLFGDVAIVDVSGTPNLPKPANLGDGEAMAPGRPVFLVGYPGEPELFPQPTITEGILSRTREWAAGEWTFLQSDATVVGGQSGGALVDDDGDVVGITNFSFLEEFGLSGSITDAVATVERMRSVPGGSEFGDRLPPTGRGTEVHLLEFDNVWQEHILVFESPLYSDVSFDASGDSDVGLTLATIDGLDVASSDETEDGEERIDELITYRGPHVLRVESLSGAGEIRVRSNVGLTPWPDPDDGRVLSRNSTTTGNIDYPGDYDWHRVELGRGQAVIVDVDAIAFDPILMIDGPEGLAYLRAVDDDSGGGLFGSNARIVFTADEAGAFFVIVADGNSTGPGAYRLTID